MSESSVSPGGGEPTKAVRLVFSFEGDHLHLISQQSVEMTLPPSDPIEGAEGHTGFWCELRDVQDRPLFRHVMHSPIRQDVEVFSDDPKRSVARQAAPNRKGTFVCLLPDTEEGHAVALFSSPQPRSLPDSGTQVLALARQPATEIARFVLRKQ